MRVRGRSRVVDVVQRGKPMARKDKPKNQPRNERPSARRPESKNATSKPVAKASSVPSKPDAAVVATAARTPAPAPLPKPAAALPRVGARRVKGEVAKSKPAPPRSPKAKVETPAVAESASVAAPTAVASVKVTDSERPPSATHPSVQEQLHDIEQRIDALLDDVHQGGNDSHARKRAAEAIGHIAARLDIDQKLEELEGTTLLTSAREIDRKSVV